MKGVHYDIKIEVRPEMNPDLHLPDVLWTRRGVTCGPGNGEKWTLTSGEFRKALTTKEATLVWEMLTGLRAIDHRLEKFKETGE